ncbi:hypothetical protein DV735_g5410, partial [Chaetothyriales sp. CBS 134920]
MSSWSLLRPRGHINSTRLVKRTFTISVRLQTTAEEEYARARQWYQTLSYRPLPRIGEVSYARSSGPGGQNVNKVNSKAQLRVPLSQLCALVPPVLHRGLRQCRYYAPGSDSLLIQADDSRKQAANRDACYRRLTELVADVYRATVPGETSDAQKERVKGLKTQYNESRLQGKKFRSSKKAARSKGFGND